MTSDEKFMTEAIKLSIKNIEKGGGPFGAIIVKDGRIIARGTNTVTIDNDPTAHAEINAIRKAAKKLGTFNLEGCNIYTSCEPCPMCLGAIYWARIDKIYFANTKNDAKKINFDDDFIYKEIHKPINKRKKRFIQIMRKEALVAFEKWSKTENKIMY